MNFCINNNFESILDFQLNYTLTLKKEIKIFRKSAKNGMEEKY